jgi:hypothetical protein
MGGPVDDAADKDAVDDNAVGPKSVREKWTSAVVAAAAFRDVIAAQDAAMTTTTMGGYGSSRPRKRGGARLSRKRRRQWKGGGWGATSAVPTSSASGARMLGVAQGRAPPPPAGNPRRQGWRGRAILCPTAGVRWILVAVCAIKEVWEGGRGGMRNDGSGGVQEQGGRHKRASIVVGRRGGGGGDGGGNVGRYVRLAMRGTIAKLYEVSWAAAHVAAVNAGEYALRRVRGGSVVVGMVLGTADDHDPRERSGTGNEGSCGVLRVDDDNNVPLGMTLYAALYSKGMEGRGMYEERAEIIGLSVLSCVLELVYNADPSSDCADSDNRNGGGVHADSRLHPA